MRRQSTESMAVRPSIALLQERFRKLQRQREERGERREEQKLLKLLTSSFHSEMVVSPVLSKPPLDYSLSLRLSPTERLENCRDFRTQKIYLWSDDLTMKSNSPCSDNSEVDTSLHL
ncbi:hypothetical protein NMG60_11035309 [Bertholletia excelsa]